MNDGIIVINKPAGYTSFDCIAILRGITGIRKMGHTGTLDPNATGVLPVCLGKAAKLIEYMDTASKTYICGVRFGTVTDTQDIWGRASEGGDISKAPKSFEELETALSAFSGEIEQVPPSFSAVFVNGRRAYDMARNGESPDLKPRKITVYSTELLDYDAKKAEGHFKICCSRGTYVRTVCHDLGRMLGCGACLSSLLRTEACGFTLSDALDLEEARMMDRASVMERILPLSRAIGSMQTLSISSEESVKYLNGMTIKRDPKGFEQGKPVAVFYNGELVGISRFEGSSLKPVKIFI